MDSFMGCYFEFSDLYWDLSLQLTGIGYSPLLVAFVSHPSPSICNVIYPAFLTKVPHPRLEVLQEGSYTKRVVTDFLL